VAARAVPRSVRKAAKAAKAKKARRSGVVSRGLTRARYLSYDASVKRIGKKKGCGCGKRIR
jgi:hypothetical protein